VEVESELDSINDNVAIGDEDTGLTADVLQLTIQDQNFDSTKALVTAASMLGRAGDAALIPISATNATYNPVHVRLSDGGDLDGFETDDNAVPDGETRLTVINLLHGYYSGDWERIESDGSGALKATFA